MAPIFEAIGGGVEAAQEPERLTLRASARSVAVGIFWSLLALCLFGGWFAAIVLTGGLTRIHDRYGNLLAEGPTAAAVTLTWFGGMAAIFVWAMIHKSRERLRPVVLDRDADAVTRGGRRLCALSDITAIRLVRQKNQSRLEANARGNAVWLATLTGNEAEVAETAEIVRRFLGVDREAA